MSQTEEGVNHAREALLRYMEWWSEETYAAGWLSNLETIIFESDSTARWLRKMAGGYWSWDNDSPPSYRKFIED